MEKTIRIGSIYTEEGYDGVYIWTSQTCIGWISLKGQTTKEIIESGDNPSTFPDYICKRLNSREAIALHKAAVELGMNEHEDVTYWLRDYIVEKIRENG